MEPVLTASRDLKVFKEGPASLCLSTAGDAKGNIVVQYDLAARHLGLSW